MPVVRHKKQLNINVSPYLMNELESMVADKKEFSGMSDVCTIAITQFIERYKYMKQSVSAQTPTMTENRMNPLLEIFPSFT